MPEKPIFAKSNAHSIGIEMELQLIHPETMDLHPVAEEILARWKPSNDRLKPELLKSMIEVNTGICVSIHQAEEDLRETIAALKFICNDVGAVVASNGTHPTAHHYDREIFPAERYRELIDRNQFIARRLMIFGLHVHVGARNGEHCIRMNNEFIAYLPHLLALSASSPYWEGRDTGLASSRITVFEALPTGGHPCAVASWQEYQSLVQKLIRSRAIRDLKDLWWDIRPSPHYGTLEIRVCDGLPSLRETMAVCALIHCLAVHFDEREARGERVPLLPDWLIRENKWRASRHGLNADIVTNEHGDTAPILEDIERLLWTLAPIAESLGYQEYFEVLRYEVMARPSYERQRRVFAETGSLKAVTESLVKEFDRGLFGREIHRRPPIKKTMV